MGIHLYIFKWSNYLPKLGIRIVIENIALHNFPEEVLNVGDYVLELELNNEKKRAGIYINKKINYKRRIDLEKKNCHIVIIDVINIVNTRVINIYRSFRPPGLKSPEIFFNDQLELMANVLTNNCCVLDDFNLDANMTDSPDYHRRIPLEKLNTFALNANLSQMVKFSTWSRTTCGVQKESLLDHVCHQFLQYFILYQL